MPLSPRQLDQAVPASSRQSSSRRLPPLRSRASPSSFNTGSSAGNNSSSSSNNTGGSFPHHFHSHRQSHVSVGSPQAPIKGKPMPKVRPQRPAVRPTYAAPDMVITGFSPVPNGSHTPSIFPSSEEKHVHVRDLSPDVVFQYLRQNPDVLDQFVASHVNSERIDRWLYRKSHGVSRTPGTRFRQDPTLNGESGAEKCTSLSRWKSRIHASKNRVLQELSKDSNHVNSKTLVLHELATCVAAAISADGHNLYSVDESKQELTHISTNATGAITHGATERVGFGTSLAAQVAYSKEPIRLQNMLKDKRYPDGLGVGNNKAHAVLALPAVDAESKVIGVVEFYRFSKHSSFNDEEEEVGSFLLHWADMLIDYVETHNTMRRQRTLNEFLLEVTKSIFQDIVSMDAVIMKIMNFAQKLVSADRASLFLVDHYSRELYARIFDIGSGGGSAGTESGKQKEIRFWSQAFSEVWRS